MVEPLRTNAASRPKKEKKKKKKKPPAFYTSVDDLLPFGVRQANELVTTSLGVVVTVLGVKYANLEDKTSGCLWVQYRSGFQSPLDTELHGPKPRIAGENIWRDFLKLKEVVDKDEEEREIVEHLNAEYQRKQETKRKRQKKKAKPQTA